jgi:hypothetical protein
VLANIGRYPYGSPKTGKALIDSVFSVVRCQIGNAPSEVQKTLLSNIRHLEIRVKIRVKTPVGTFRRTDYFSIRYSLHWLINILIDA